MCVWDGTYTLSEEEREALDQVPGWNDDAVSIQQTLWRKRVSGEIHRGKRQARR
jgi:hypothetical protein